MDDNQHTAVMPQRINSVQFSSDLLRPRNPRTLERAASVDGTTSDDALDSGRFNQHDDAHRLAKSVDVGVERRRRTSQKKRHQLVRLSSSSYVPIPLDGEGFRSQIRSQGSRVEALGGSIEEREPEEQEIEGPVDPNIDGGWAWLVMVAAFLLIFVVDGISFSFGVFLDQLTKEFGQDKSTTSLVGSVLSGVYLGAGPIAIALAERFGYRVVGCTGAILSSAAFLASSWSPNITTMIVLYGAAGGLGFCFMYLTSMVSTSLYFEKKRPLAVGIASCGSGVGIFVFPLLMEKLYTIISWRNCVRVQAGIILLSAVFALAFKPLQTQQEEQQERRTFKDAIKKVLDVSLLKKPVIWIIAAMGVLATIGISTPFIYIKDMAQTKGVEEGQATWLISMIGITNTVGRVLVGALVYSCPVNPLLLLAAGCIIGGALTAASSLYTSFAVLAVYAVLFGNVYALDAALSTEILSRTLGRDRVAGSFGLLCLVRGLAFAAGGPIAGSLFDYTGDYDATFYMAGGAIILTGILAIIAFILTRRTKQAAIPGIDADVTDDNVIDSSANHRQSLLAEEGAGSSKPSYGSGATNEAMGEFF